MVCINDKICDIRERNVTIRSEIWTTNIRSLGFQDIREWVTLIWRLILRSLGCTSLFWRWGPCQSNERLALAKIEPAWDLCNHVKWSDENSSPKSIRLVSQLYLEILMRGFDINSKEKFVRKSKRKIQVIIWQCFLVQSTSWGATKSLVVNYVI